MALVVITGGARSGKSAAAASLARLRGGDVVVAVFGDPSTDPEMAERIARHRADRPGHWTTLESPSLADADVPEGALLLVDCLGSLLARVMEEEWASEGEGAYGASETVSAGFVRAVDARTDEVVRWLGRRAGDTVVVTNEAGAGVVPAYALGRVFRDALGRANRALAEVADASWLVVAGRCLDLNALASRPSWPAD